MTAIHAAFLENPGEMVFHGARGDEQGPADFGVGSPVEDQGADLALAGRQFETVVQRSKIFRPGRGPEALGVREESEPVPQKGNQLEIKKNRRDGDRLEARRETQSQGGRDEQNQSRESR